MRDFVSLFFLLPGVFFMLVSAVGVLRLPDTYTRMHAASKASSLGISLILLGVVIHLPSASVIWKSLLTVFFIYLTVPIATHILGRAAYLSDSKPSDLTVTDEISDLYRPSGR
ncbi:MAG TPA: monovalent cation/H(+) antiporter subunit G [Pseudobdellovibrionaceae bacterium]|nr:monovalent cation/H(+) antiporter subunit G [Pseudobdellovibrionaceae bacterium]